MRSRFAALAAAMLLAGCQGEISLDLTTEPAGRAEVAQLVVSLAGVEFTKSDGAAERLEYADSEPVDLVAFANGDVVSLFTDEPLPPGGYTGVRLLFDADTDLHYVIDLGGRRFPVSVAAGVPAPVDFEVVRNETVREALTLTLDVRQSLRFVGGSDGYSLQPVLRSVPAEEAGILAGRVTISCPSGTSLAGGGAVYLFQGTGIVPDDRDGSGVEPYATTSLDRNLASGEFTYALLDLPPGPYTLAATCRGHLEDPAADDPLGFAGTRSVELEAEEVLTVNIAG